MVTTTKKDIYFGYGQKKKSGSGRGYHIIVTLLNAMVKPKTGSFKYRKVKKGGGSCLKNRLNAD